MEIADADIVKEAICEEEVSKKKIDPSSPKVSNIVNRMMLAAVEEGKKCSCTETAYNVGAIITKLDDQCQDEEIIVAKGYSRELPGNTHAEESALIKLGLSHLRDFEDAEEELKNQRLKEDCADGKATGCALYTTMEPCSKRLSGNRSCTSRILAAKVAKVVVGVQEPDKFVACEGTKMLQDKGIVVEYVNDESLINECKQLNKHLFH